jgi:hypothetical protein
MPGTGAYTAATAGAPARAYFARALRVLLRVPDITPGGYNRFFLGLRPVTKKIMQ